MAYDEIYEFADVLAPESIIEPALRQRELGSGM